ncbi:hypothetical protein GCM10010840_33920 [Deinococcus aerolatus]|uniref:Uncharacterized protein n=1 Tax=Deinococcus aerolatus TaxID=522487 RepID=A0ABQ2GFN7_9DEIO|nr:hypothetical protein [Deinococcus aerolatus]GGL93107.1 hypothetical protein GCM10010840_33920 [Deinococcus aerolatus]
MKTEHLQINLPVQADSHIERLMRWVADPADLNALVCDSLAVFVIHAERAAQRLCLTEPEVGALLSTVRDLTIDPESAQFLPMVLKDALEFGLADEWNIDGISLLWRLQALHSFEATALAMTLKAAWTIRTRYGGDAMKAAHFLGLLPPKATIHPM